MNDTTSNPTAVVTGAFDNVKTADIRFLQEASKTGHLQILLYSDDLYSSCYGKLPKFPVAERKYFLESIRYVNGVKVIESREDRSIISNWNEIKKNNASQITWVVNEEENKPDLNALCSNNGVGYQVVLNDQIKGFPLEAPYSADAHTGKKVVVTGSFDWMHSGHVRFFEEASEWGDLFAIVGHDANIKLLKGEGHPLFSQDERRYLVQSVRFVKQALISSGHGWMDAEPEINLIKPDFYVVNEDGDKPEKSVFCKEHGIEYKVLKRLPKPGLPRRESTALRGF